MPEGGKEGREKTSKHSNKSSELYYFRLRYAWLTLENMPLFIGSLLSHSFFCLSQTFAVRMVSTQTLLFPIHTPACNCELEKHQPDIETSMYVSKCLCSPLLWAGCAAGLGESTEMSELTPGLASSTNKSGPWDSAVKLVEG